MSRKSRRTHSPFAKSDTFTFSNAGLYEEGAGHRQARLERILLDELQSLIGEEATDPSLQGIKLLAVQLSPDGGHARVAYAVVTSLCSEREVSYVSKSGLMRATGFLRARIAQQLDLKKLPKLSFTFVGITALDLRDATDLEELGGEPWHE